MYYIQQSSKIVCFTVNVLPRNKNKLWKNRNFFMSKKKLKYVGEE